MIIDPAWLVPLAILAGVIVTWIIYRDRKRGQAEEKASLERQSIIKDMTEVKTDQAAMKKWMSQMQEDIRELRKRSFGA